MSINALIEVLKENNQDFEFYPTTKEILEVIKNDYNMTEAETVLDIGCGTCNFKKVIKPYQYYVVEKSKILIDKLDEDTIVLGTDFNSMLLLDKKVDVIFCNPPYSEYENWTKRIIWEGNCKYIYLVIPQRWKENKEIQECINNAKARVSVLGNFNFYNAERQARAVIDIVKIDKREHSNYYGYRKELEEINETAFDKWFEDTFAQRDSSNSNKNEYEIEKEKKENIKNQLVCSESKAKMLVELYEHEQQTLFEHFLAITRLDEDILKTIGVNKKAVKEALKQKIKSLKVLYWNIVFEEMEEITSRLTYKTRKKMLEKFSNLLTIDFTVENMYPLILWVIKNANKYYEEQVLDFFDYLTAPDNIQNYKSNQKVFKRNQWYPENFDNKKEVSHYTLAYRVICKILHHSDRYLDRYSNYQWALRDVFTIANNLGFTVNYDSIQPKYTYGEKYEVLLMDGKTFMSYRCYKNGNMHIKFNKEFMKALNVECSRLLGWIQVKEDIAREFPEDMAKGAEKYFKSNYTCIGTNGSLMLTTGK